MVLDIKMSAQIMQMIKMSTGSITNRTQSRDKKSSRRRSRLNGLCTASKSTASASVAVKERSRRFR